MSKIKAISFDLWDTLVIDDSDEPKRKAQGLGTKKQERRRVLWEALNAQALIERGQVDLVFDAVDAAFNKVWHDQYVTWTLRERLAVLLAGLGRTLPAPDSDRVVERLAAMEVDIPPDLIPGAADSLAELAERYRLCICSDAVFTPGTELRRLLAVHGVLEHFSGFAFSDEVGRCKPHPSMFETAADALGVRLTQMVHIGDRQHNDIAGAQALDIKAVLFTASRDVDAGNHTADAVCNSHADLPQVIAELDA